MKTSEVPVPRILDSLLVDFRYALRSLRSQLQLSGMVTGILAIAVACVTVVFSIIHLFVLTPGVVGNTDRLGWVFGVDLEGANDRGLVSIPDFLDIRDRARSFEMLAARSGQTMILTGYGQAVRLGVLEVTVNHLPVWNITLFRGRPFVEEDAAPGATPVAILNYHVWQGRLGGDESLVGRTIFLDGEAVSVIGVLDPKYPTGALGDLWMPLSLEAGRYGPRDNRTVALVGLLQPEATLLDAHQEVRTIALQLQREHPSTNSGMEARVVDTWRGWIGPQTYYNLGLLGVGALLVLVIGCVNVALLLLARAITREQEVLVRVALGASPGRLVAQQAIEGLVLAVPGMAAGLTIAIWAILALKTSGASSFARLSIDWGVFSTAALVALVWPLIFAAIPALGVGVRRSLGPRDARGTEGSRASRLHQRSLAMLQVGSALTLLVVAGMVVRSFAATLAADLGVDRSNVVNVSLTLPAWKYKDPGEFTQFFAAAVEKVRSYGEVSHAAATSSVPGLLGAGTPRLVQAETGDAIGYPAPQLNAQLVSVMPRTFETLGVPVLLGREFTPADSGTAPPVVIINRKLAQALPAGPHDLIGRRLAVRGESFWREIVGIVGDTRDADFESFRPLVFLPHAQEPQRTMTLLARMPHGPSSELVTGAILEVDPDVAPYQVRTYDEGVSTRISVMLTIFAIFGSLAAAATILAVVGLYGAFSCGVSGRMREFGIRQALGASAAQIRGLVFREGWQTVLPGMALGMLGGAALARYAVGALYTVRVDPWDSVTYAACGGFLVAACALALWVPARRAAKSGARLADLLR